MLGEFEDQTWTVLNYAYDNDEWVSRATNCPRFLLARRAEPQKQDERIDLAIVCALAKPEQAEVLKLPWNWSAARPIDDLVFVHDGHLAVGGRRLTVCLTTAPRMGMVSTGLRTASIIALLKPRLVAMIGICAGVRDKVKLGDVLFADPSWDFQSGKRVRDKENTQFSMRPHHLPASALVRSHVEQLRDDKAALGAIATNYPENPSGVPRIFVGPVASGSAVLADGNVIKEIRAQHQELIGVEMEIYGVRSSARRDQAAAIMLRVERRVRFRRSGQGRRTSALCRICQRPSPGTLNRALRRPARRSLRSVQIFANVSEAGSYSRSAYLPGRPTCKLCRLCPAIKPSLRRFWGCQDRIRTIAIVAFRTGVFGAASRLCGSETKSRKTAVPQTTFLGRPEIDQIALSFNRTSGTSLG